MKNSITSTLLQVKKDEMGRAWNTNVAKSYAYRRLVEKPEGKRPLGRPRCRWADNIKMDLRDIVWGVMDWIDVARNRTKGGIL
jgi:hypothetical protein